MAAVKKKKVTWPDVFKFVSLKDDGNVELSRFVDFSRLVDFEKSSDFILLASTNRQNTGSAAFHGRESIKHIIRLFSKAAWY